MRQRPLRSHALFETDNLDCAREKVAQKFCNHRLDIIGNGSSFHAAHHYAPGAMISLNYIAYGADVLIDPDELDNFYLIQIPIAGGASVQNGRWKFDTGSHTASVLNPHWVTRMRWWQGCQQLLVQIHKAPFLDFAERYLGRSLASPISFEPVIDLTRPEMDAWRAQMMALVHAADGSDASPTLTSALCEQQLLEAFVRHQPHDMSDFVDNAPRQTIPRYLKRAVEFMRENAAQPLTITSVAQAAGVSGRSLQLAWKQAYGISPMQDLMRERMRRVRYDLKQDHAPPSVADVATKWGFSHLGRFSAAYRDEFGEYPRETLQGRKGARASI